MLHGGKKKRIIFKHLLGINSIESCCVNTIKIRTFLLPFDYLCVCSVAQSSLTLCDPVDCSPWGFSVHGISQARILEQVAISFSRGSSQPRDRTCISCLAGWFFITEPPGKLWTTYSTSLMLTLPLNPTGTGGVASNLDGNKKKGEVTELSPFAAGTE